MPAPLTRPHRLPARTAHPPPEWIGSLLLAVAGAAKILDVADDALPPPLGPPERPPPGERRRTWESYARRRRHDALMMLSMLARAARHEPGGWAEVKSVALLAPHERLVAAPIDVQWIVVVGTSFGFDLSPLGSDHHLLPTVLELCRAPLPPNWTLVPPESPASSPGAKGVADHNTANLADASVYRHFNVVTGEVADGHPLAKAMATRIKGIAARASRSNRAKPTDGWLQLAHKGGGFYFTDLRSGHRSESFPYVHGLTACVLPPRVLEPSAARLADAGEAWASALAKRAQTPSAFLQQVKNTLWRPVLGPRAAQLSHEPCPLEALVHMGHYLGVDACLAPDVMWIVDCALTPQVHPPAATALCVHPCCPAAVSATPLTREVGGSRLVSLQLPIGWQAQHMKDGQPYYTHGACGMAMWEHPQTAFLTGVVRQLNKANAEDLEKRRRTPLRGDDEEDDEGARGANTKNPPPRGRH